CWGIGPPGAVKVWDVASRRLVAPLPGYSGPGTGVMVSSLAFSPRGRRLAVASQDLKAPGPAAPPALGGVNIWDVARRHALRQLRGHTGSVTSVDFHPGGRYLASAGFDKTVRVWDTAKGEEVRPPQRHATEVLRVAFSPDGRRLASAGADLLGEVNGQIKLWDLDAPDQAHTIRTHSSGILNLAFSPDGGRLASAGSDGTVRLYDTDTP